MTRTRVVDLQLFSVRPHTFSRFLVDAMPVKAQFGGPDRSSCVVVDRRGTVHSFDAETGQEVRSFLCVCL